jgi:hypothetical protein
LHDEEGGCEDGCVKSFSFRKAVSNFPLAFISSALYAF